MRALFIKELVSSRGNPLFYEFEFVLEPKTLERVSETEKALARCHCWRLFAWIPVEGGD